MKCVAVYSVATYLLKYVRACNTLEYKGSEEKRLDENDNRFLVYEQPKFLFRHFDGYEMEDLRDEI